MKDVGEPTGLILAKKVVEWGWRVAPGFCSKEGEKVPLCGNWVLNATKDVGVLEKWWAERAWMWPGVVSGVDSCLVVDCDSPCAVERFRGVVGEVGWIGGGLSYKTPGRGGGLHCIWTWPKWLDGGFRQAKFSVEGGGEIQIRGNGCWTLLAGARRPDVSSGRYEIFEEPGTEGPIEAPERLLRALLVESFVSVGRGHSGELEEMSPDDAWGQAPWTDGRKNTCAAIAWWMSIRGWEEEDVVEMCMRFGSECCLPVLNAETCEKKARYAFGRAKAHREKTAREIERSIGRWAGGRKWRS